MLLLPWIPKQGWKTIITMHVLVIEGEKKVLDQLNLMGKNYFYRSNNTIKKRLY